MYLSGPTALAVFHGAAEVAHIIYIELTGKVMRSSNNSLRTSARGVRAPRGADNLIDIYHITRVGGDGEATLLFSRLLTWGRGI